MKYLFIIKIFFIPKNIYYLLIGVIITGIGNGWNLIASMPEILIYGHYCANEGT